MTIHIGILYLIIAIQLSGFAFMLTFKRQHRPGEWLFALYCFSLAVYYIICWLFSAKDPHIAFIPTRFFHPVLSLIGSILYTYTLIMTSEKQNFKREYLWYFLPFFLYYLTDIILFVIYGDTVFTESFYFRNPVTLIEYYSPWFLILLFAALIFIRLQKFRLILLNRFSNTESINFKWLKTILFLCILASLATTFVLLPTIIFGRIFPGDMILRVLLGIALLFGGYAGYQQIDIFANYRNPSNQDINFTTSISKGEISEQDKNESDHYPNHTYNSRELKKIYNRLEEIMKKEKVYLEPDLNLFALAQRLDVTIQKLSTTINTHSKKNFFEYINAFRVDDVKKTLKGSKVLIKDIVSIGMECGFNSKSSFFRIFKDFTGQTPGEFHKVSHNPLNSSIEK